MDPNKAQMKNLGNKLTEEAVESTNKDLSKHLENLNVINNSKEEAPVLKLKAHDIELLKRELDLTNDEAKKQLIKYKGNVEDVIEAFLNDFCLD